MRFSSSLKRPKSWSEMKLADVCKTFTSGGTPSRKRPDFYINGSIPWVKTKELNDGVVTEVEEFITTDALKNSSAKLLPRNTVLLAMYGATVGKLGVLGIEAACNQACAAMVPKDGVVDFRFLYYLLMRHREEIIGQAIGGAQQNLSGELIKGFTFDFPTFQEQQAIANSLWVLDEKISANRAVSKTLEEIAATVFKSWFIDFDPVKSKVLGEKPVGIDEATSALFPDSMEDSELGQIPTGWAVGTMADLFGLQGGFAFKSSSWAEDGVPVIKIGSVKPGLVDLNQVSYVDELLAQKTSSAYRLPRGSLVIGLTGYVGEVGLLKQHHEIPLLNQRVAKFLPVNGTWKIPFIYCLTRRPQFKQRVIDAANGSAQQNVSNSQILSLRTLVPPIELVKSFNDQFESLFDQILSFAEQNDNLSQLRDSLLPRLISGELQIPEEMLAS